MNRTYLAGKLVGQYELPYANIHAIEIEYEGTEYIVHLSEYMYNQIDFLRDKQILEIKEQINKIPNKISIVSVVFVVPLILLLVLGPFLIEILV